MDDPITAIEQLMKVRGWDRRHLLPVFGTSARTSEVMSRKRPLSIAHIRCLVFNYGMDADVMIQWYPTDQQPIERETTFDAISSVVRDC